MATQVQLRRGTSTQHNSFTGASGEVTVNTTNKSVHVHDGSTQGGFELARADLSNFSGVITATTFSGTIGDITGTATTTTTTSATAIVSISASTYRSAVFQVQSVEGTKYNITTINVIHDGSETYMTEYGTINQPVGVATFSTDINGGSLRLLAYPSSANSTTFKVMSTSVKA